MFELSPDRRVFQRWVEWNVNEDAVKALSLDDDVSDVDASAVSVSTASPMEVVAVPQWKVDQEEADNLLAMANASVSQQNMDVSDTNASVAADDAGDEDSTVADSVADGNNSDDSELDLTGGDAAIATRQQELADGAESEWSDGEGSAGDGEGSQRRRQDRVKMRYLQAELKKLQRKTASSLGSARGVKRKVASLGEEQPAVGDDVSPTEGAGGGKKKKNKKAEKGSTGSDAPQGGSKKKGRQLGGRKTGTAAVSKKKKATVSKKKKAVAAKRVAKKPAQQEAEELEAEEAAAVGQVQAEEAELAVAEEQAEQADRRKKRKLRAAASGEKSVAAAAKKLSGASNTTPEKPSKTGSRAVLLLGLAQSNGVAPVARRRPSGLAALQPMTPSSVNRSNRTSTRSLRV